MAKSNKTEIDSSITSNIAATVTTTKHKTVLNLVSESAQLKKDIIGSTQTATGSAGTTASVTANFSAMTLAVIDADTNDVNLNISVSNLGNGETAWIKVTKNAGRTIQFTSVTNTTINQQSIDDDETTVVYEVVQKDSVVYARCISYDNSDVGDEWTYFSSMTIQSENGNDVTSPTIKGYYHKYARTYMCTFSAIITSPVEAGTDYNELEFNFSTSQGSPSFPSNFIAPAIMRNTTDGSDIFCYLRNKEGTSSGKLTLTRGDSAAFDEGDIFRIIFNFVAPID